MSKVGEIIKVNSPPGTIGHLHENGATGRIPFFDEDLPGKGIRAGDEVTYDPPTEERAFATNIHKKNP